MSDRFPRPYVNEVPKEEGGDKQMVYVPFKTMGIGARPSGLPKEGMNDIKSLTHVGGDASSSRTFGAK